VEISTPFLDELASRGVLFEDAWAAANITRPSHASLLTGKLLDQAGVLSNLSTLAQQAHTLGEVFAQRGWLTYAAVSTLVLGEPQSGTEQGFDRYGAPSTPQRRCNETLNSLRSWLPSAEGLPLFLWLHVYDAHAPYDPPPAWQRLYYPADRDPASPDLPELSPAQRPRWPTSARDPLWFEAQYRSEISFLDAELAGLFVEPRLAHATIAVTADHGESLTGRALSWDHVELYPDTLHVPLILVGPGFPSGLRVARPVMIRDVGRTLLDASGGGAVEFPGRDLLAEEAPLEPRFALGSGGRYASIQSGPWYLLLHLDPDPDHPRTPQRHAVELYDLADDRACQHERSGDRPEVARELRRALLAWLGGFRPPPVEASQAPSARELEMLEALGYGGSASGSETLIDIDPDCRCERCRVFE
jgi:arylsulfatase A-like enzyme